MELVKIKVFWVVSCVFLMWERSLIELTNFLRYMAQTYTKGCFLTCSFSVWYLVVSWLQSSQVKGYLLSWISMWRSRFSLFLNLRLQMWQSQRSCRLFFFVIRQSSFKVFLIFLFCGSCAFRMCLMRFLTSEYFFLQKRQCCLIFLCIRSMCILRWFLFKQVKEQQSQANFSSVCLRRCTLRLVLMVLAQLYWEYLQGFSLVWIFRWVCSECLNLKILLQYL